MAVAPEQPAKIHNSCLALTSSVEFYTTIRPNFPQTKKHFREFKGIVLKPTNSPREN